MVGAMLVAPLLVAAGLQLAERNLAAPSSASSYQSWDSSRGGMSERECTLEKRGKFQNGGEPVRGGPRSTRIKSAIPSANGRRAAKHEHGRNDDGKSTAVCSRKKRLWKRLA